MFQTRLPFPRRRCPAAALLIIAATLCLPAVSRADDWVYTLRPGDDLWSIAATYCGSTRYAADIVAHNNLADASRIRAGQRILIPTHLLTFEPSHATILEVAGDVDLRRAQGASASVQAGTRIDMGDQLVTRVGSALIQFADLSTVVIQPDSSVLFNKLTAFGPAGMVDTHLRFTYGRGTATVRPQNRGDRFRIQTPEGVAAVRGTQFRVGHSEADGTPRSNTETLEGLVAFARSGASTDVPQGFGVAAGPGGVVKETLLTAPQWISTDTSIATAGQLAWSALPGAERYLLSWASATNPDVTLAEQVVTGTSATVASGPGEFVFSVRGVSGNGIEGFDARRGFTVLNPAPRISTPANITSGITTLSWDYPATNQPFELTINADHWQQARTYQLNSPSWQQALPPGQYQWQVRAGESVASEPGEFTLLPATPSNIRVEQDGKTLRISWPVEPGITTYRLHLAATNRPGTAPMERTLTPDGDNAVAELTVDRYGSYQLQLTASANGLDSAPAERRFNVLGRPWWLTLLLPLVIF